MSKNQINFSKMSEEARTQLENFKTNTIAYAKEDLRYKAEIKPFKEELNIVLEKREKALENGLTVDEVTKQFSRVEIDNEIRKALHNHKTIIEPINKSIHKTYKFIPDKMYNAYVKKITQQKRGDFLAVITEFLSNLGIEGCTQGQISKFSETMSDMFGAQLARSKTITEKNIFISAMSQKRFNKLFMAVFCDTFM